MAEDDVIQVELMVNRFRRLIGELQCGHIHRNHFEPWEIGILLDLQDCHLDARRRVEILRQYGKAAERQIENGSGPPMKLSEFLALRYQKRVS